MQGAQDCRQLERSLNDLRASVQAKDAELSRFMAAEVSATNGTMGFYPVPAAPVQGNMSDEEYIKVCHRLLFFHLQREV